jgi:general secretion pathway protein K
MMTPERGIVLVVVLWIVALLSIMAASFGSSIRTETVLATSQVERARAHALAEAGVAYAVTHILSPSALQEWPLDGTPREWRFGLGRVRIAITGAGGTVDLNRGNRELLGALLASAGVEEDKLDSLLDAIEDWRDNDELRSLNGAESDDYRAAGLDFGPKNGPFERVEELQQVLGMTPGIYQQIQSELTVHSRLPGIDPAMASAKLLGVIPNIDQQVLQEYLESRTQSVAEGTPLPEPPFSGANLSQGRSLAYHIKAMAFTDSGSTASVEAVIEPGRRRGLPYNQLVWREGK